MFDVWLGNVELTDLWLTLGVVWVFPVQLLLCWKAKSLLLRLAPAAMLGTAIFVFLVMWLVLPGWDGLGCMVFAILAGVMLLFCGLAWGTWALIRRIWKQ